MLQRYLSLSSSYLCYVCLFLHLSLFHPFVRAQTDANDARDESSIQHYSNESDINSTPLTTAVSQYTYPTSPVMLTSTSTREDFEEDLLISTETLAICGRDGLRLNYKATSGTISFQSDGTGTISINSPCKLDLSAPEGLVLHFQILQLEGSCMCGFFVMLIRDGIRKHFLEMTQGDCEHTGIHSEVFSYSEKVEMSLFVTVSESCFVHLNFTAVPEERRPQIEVNFTSPTEGHIQTPAMNDKNPYPHNMDSWVRVDVPEHHDVMTSFAYLAIEGSTVSCVEDSVSLYLGSDNPSDLEWTACTAYRPLPALYNTRMFFIRFRSDYRFAYPGGFKLLFSFHPQTALPQSLPSGKWNCSVTYFPDFERHFRCDYHQDCAGAEDETNCSYTGEQCGAGLITVGGRCYKLMMQNDVISWGDASKVCQLEGAHLASLNTPSEWHDVTQLLRTLFIRLYVGLASSSPALPHMYHRSLQWMDEPMAYFLHTDRKSDVPECGYYFPEDDAEAALPRLASVSVGLCVNSRYQTHALCEMHAAGKSDEQVKVQLSTVSQWTSQVSGVTCPRGHVTHAFLSCDMQSACWGAGLGSSAACDAPVTPLPPSFTCANGIEHVPYTLVCDFRSDCRDGSDEDFCVFPPCDVINEFSCGNLQCVAADARCDRVEQCVNGADEKRCNTFTTTLSDIWKTPPPPARVDFDGRGTFTVLPLNASIPACPETHFRCPGDGYCLPVYVRCNGVYDCPGKEDEAACDSYTCPGFYRCRASRICLHPDHVCDGLAQCPQRDDELVCDLRCPQDCTCYGAAFYCKRPFPVQEYPDLRYLDASGSGMKLEDFADNKMLIYLSLVNCELTELQSVQLPNLHSLDLSNNNIVTIQVTSVTSFSRLAYLSLSGNPLAYPFLVHTARSDSVSHVKILDLSHLYLPETDAELFSVFPDLQVLNLSQSGVLQVSDGGFQTLKDLQVLDLRGCPITFFPRDIFQDLTHLESVQADNYKLCCQETLPSGFNLGQCHAPVDEISSCDALLRSDVYRVLLSVVAVLALLGNLGSFVYRVFISKTKTKSGFSVFVTHLCVSDFLMGVYLAVIGVADRVFLGSYLWKDVTWKNSAACHLAGFLSLLSSEVSAFIICLITFDRFLVLRFPFSTFRFHGNSAHMVCIVAWIVGLFLACVPLLPVTSHWEFYSQTGICIPLPITRKEFQGHAYSFAIMIVLNFILFLLIAAGQVFIYWSIRVNSMSMNDTSASKSKDLTIARRLFTVVMSDFLCWFPIGVLGLLASSGVPVPGEVSVAMAIIVLPLNSALNPFLYTVNAILERRRKSKEQRLHQHWSRSTKLQTVTTITEKVKQTYTQSEACSLLHSWIKQGLISPDTVADLLDAEPDVTDTI